MIPISLPEGLRDHPMYVSSLNFVSVGGGATFLVIEFLDDIHLENLFTSAINTRRKPDTVLEILECLGIESRIPKYWELEAGTLEIHGYESRVRVSTPTPSTLEVRPRCTD